MHIFSPIGLRVDGRRPHELRKIDCKIGPLTQADGSAFLEQGNTKVLATVYGPHDVRMCLFYNVSNSTNLYEQILNLVQIIVINVSLSQTLLPYLTLHSVLIIAVTEML